MKILYITSPGFMDMDISFVNALSKYASVKVLIEVNKLMKKASAFSLDELVDDIGIIPASSYPGMEKYSEFINVKDWYIINDPTANSWKSAIVLSRKIAETINSFKPDILHVSGIGKIVTLLVPFLKRDLKTLLSVHDVISHNSKSNLRSRIVHYHDILMYRRFKNILLYSEIADDLIEERMKGVPHTLYHSKLGSYDFLKKFPNTENYTGKYILFSGRIDYYKGLDVLLQSFYKSKLPGQDIKLIIAGKSRISIKDNIDDENVILMNRYIENEELANLIRNSMFMVLPYRTATQSGVTKSAFALGKPILCTDAGNLPNEVINGKYGKVVKADDIDELTQGLNWMISHPAEVDHYSVNIIKDWDGQGNNSWDSIVNSLVKEVYETII